MAAPRILVVGARQDSCALAELLEMAGYVTARASTRNTRRVAQQFRPDIVVADVAYPAIDGRVLLDDLQPLEPSPRVVMVTSRPTSSVAGTLVNCLTKPLDLPLLWAMLARLNETTLRETA
jgi:CheY-like chemotaxis protein